jgi:hypothetical protein
MRVKPEERVLIESFMGDGFWFSNDWNGLMAVVAKISEYRMAFPKQTAWVCDSKIVIGQKYLYREVVNFIKWFKQL